MTLPTSPFRFDESSLPASPALVAEVPPGISSKAALLEELYQRLRFPDYFGGNWDALWECIRDLSWLPPGPVILRHHDLPLAGDVASQKTYLSILSDAAERRWSVPGQQLRDLVVVFPPETREQVTWLLRSAAHDEAQR
jgi:RNAse (barnase) inhibitor barstar